jgi:hypothetical protein
MSDGTLMPTDPPGNPAFAGQHKNVAQENITHEADSGIYCFNVAFTPKSAMVAGDTSMRQPPRTTTGSVSVALDRGAGLDLCPGADARVVTTHVGDPLPTRITASSSGSSERLSPHEPRPSHSSPPS